MSDDTRSSLRDVRLKWCAECGGCLDGQGHSNDCPVLRAEDEAARASLWKFRYRRSS